MSPLRLPSPDAGSPNGGGEVQPGGSRAGGPIEGPAGGSRAGGPADGAYGVTGDQLAIDETAADVLFRAAHTAYRFTDEPVSEAQVQAIHELVKWAPTALNAQPLRVTLVRSEQGRSRLIDHLAAGNRAKSASAPLVAILSYDVDFHERLPELLPSSPRARDGFADEARRETFASFNAALQAGYFILGVRAVGLAAGPMGGFDRAGVDRDFFPSGRQRSFLVVNIGHPAPDGTFPRSPRLDYDRVVSVV